jgi:hypothetical protein
MRVLLNLGMNTGPKKYSLMNSSLFSLKCKLKFYIVGL